MLHTIVFNFRIFLKQLRSKFKKYFSIKLKIKLNVDDDDDDALNFELNAED
jgi:hypothetical protein